MIAQRALKPVALITRTAEGITVRALDQRVPLVEADSELSRLVEVINGMLDRLEKNFGQAVRFSADAAHEVATGLIAIGTTSTTISSAPAATADAFEYRTVGAVSTYRHANPPQGASLIAQYRGRMFYAAHNAAWIVWSEADNPEHFFNDETDPYTGFNSVDGDDLIDVAPGNLTALAANETSIYAFFQITCAIGIYLYGRRVMPPSFALFGALLIGLTTPRSHLAHHVFGYRYMAFSLLSMVLFARRLEGGPRPVDLAEIRRRRGRSRRPSGPGPDPFRRRQGRGRRRPR